jgi:hypothetical protein
MTFRITSAPTLPRTALALAAAAGLLLAAAPAALGQAATNGFVTYQGVLDDAGVLVNNPINVQLRIFASATGGSPVVSRSINNLPTVNGVFNAEADFGQAAFANATDLWLEVAVQSPAGSGSFVTLTPRQRLSSSVFAMNTRGLRVDAAGRASLGTQNTAALNGTLNLSTVAGDPRVLSLTNTTGTERWSINLGSSADLAFRSASATPNVLTFEADGDAVFNSATAPNPSGFGRVVALIGNATGNSSAAFVAQNTQQNATWSFGVNTAGGFSFFKSGGGANTVSVPVLQITGGSDIAEPYDVAPAPAPAMKGETAAPRPGMVVSIDPQNVGKLTVASSPYDHRVAGIISGANGVNPGLTLAQSGSVADGQFPVAKVGRVWVLADAATGPILPGDLLTSSATPGHAMRADPARAHGASLGKAMSTLKEGRGYVLVLVNLN